ncbi:hypothetical protein BBOV_III002200 [Babesia bovis T2Bo]|uniref:Uncharacterized protein n=1 Tax=Babesia bovis TaxID=5865 RepID=A7AMK3_BABBO|nr:hypothetical protein BBOV_III002200 [Babesia bovis T2Bo]EDO07787.1 hypothetical protein BBOV_III002200 [Babesia bovis T2Bo]|eukprot:XP_001611355.1 hypothetical protein [Babesia bovis T2Bo]
MSASPSTLLLRGERTGYGDAAAVQEYSGREQRRQPFSRQKRELTVNDATVTPILTKANRKNSVTRDNNRVDSKSELVSTSSQRCPNRGATKAPRKRTARGKGSEQDASDGGEATSDLSRSSSKTEDNVEPEKKNIDNNSSNKRASRPSTDTSKGDTEGSAHRKPTLIDSTLLDEALNAEDIAKAQSDLQDIDSLSQSAYSVTVFPDDDERRRRKRKCSRLQDTIVKVLNKTRADVTHLDDKIATLEAQYFTHPEDTTGLIKGWESGLLAGFYPSTQNNKARKNAPPKAKLVLGKAMPLINEHIFSLTSSTCSVSKKFFEN